MFDLYSYKHEQEKTKMEQLIILILMVLLITGISPSAFAQGPEDFGQGIEQSPHDFSHSLWLSLSKMCNVCHTLHDETLPIKRYRDGLSWKHEIFSVSYIMYHSYWGDSFVETRDKTTQRSSIGKRSNLPDGLSKFCLACHDGIIAPDVFILHHFVSAEYVKSTSHLRDPDLTIFGLSGTISEVLDRGKIQCSSCHDVHGVESIPNTKLLRAETPKLCITCHKINIKE
jgi:predicted CXXCH cytochrome family protein